MNPVLQNILTRRSVRAFTNKKITRKDLDLILKAGIYAPSGMNKQSWQFTVIQNQDKIQELAKAVRESLERDANYNFYGPDTIILLSNDKDNTNGLADCSCALQNIFLMANELGIGSCWINQLKNICDEKEIRELLNSYGIPENHIVWGIATLGYSKTPNEIKPKNESVIKFIE
ncbi:MAG: nitroreductase family protein [Clostridium butyricum]|nr:nitroreductase family protein [Clostridium butyricum]